MEETKATTKWESNPTKSPCVYLKEKCKNAKKGMINGTYYNCREFCTTYKEFEKLKVQHYKDTEQRFFYFIEEKEKEENKKQEWIEKRRK